MNWNERLEIFFKNTKKSYSIEKLIKLFKVPTSEIMSLLDALYEIEKKCLIYFNEEQEYVSIDENFFYRYGELQKSKRNNYYIIQKNASRIMLKTKEVKELKAEVGDTVFVEETICPTRETYALARAGTIVRVVRKNNWCSDDNYIISKTIHRDYKNNEYYILNNDIRIPISLKDMNGAFEKDEANVKIVYTEEEKSAKVVEVLHRKVEEKVFVVMNGSLRAIENEYAKGITAEMDIRELEEGQRVLAHYEYDPSSKEFILSNLRILKRATVSDDILAFALNHGVQKSFPADVLKEVEKLNITIKMKEKRRDERDRLTFTIDPVYAKDLDDAVSLKKVNDDLYELRVDIVDTTPFVPFGSCVFEESMRRGTSYYLSNQVFPELPDYLSTNLCSLNEGEERLTRTFMMRIDSSGNLVDYEIYNSIIRSKKKMSYDAVNDLLERSVIRDGYFEYRNTLIEMSDLSNILQKRRLERGFLILDTPELNFAVEMDGTPINVEEEHRGLSNIMIENFMILAGEMASEYAYWAGIPFMYRNHDCPEINKIIEAQESLPKINRRVQSLKQIEDVKKFQQYMSSLMKNATPEEYRYYSKIFLTAMPRAYYSDTPTGHYAMALPRYATVTSTMRRGPDQLNHLALDEFLTHRHGNEYMEELTEYIHKMGPYLSSTQQDADRLERNVEWFLLSCYAESFRGESIEATIEFFSPQGIYLKTETNIPGVIPLSKNFVYDKNQNIVRNNNLTYQIGDKILIRIIPNHFSKDGLLFELESEKKYQRVLKKGGLQW